MTVPTIALSVALLLALGEGAETPTPQKLAAPPTVQEMAEVAVLAPEPRFVAPTRRDRIGRIWAPVEVNGQGPFRLVLDTGASHSALTAKVAEMLGITIPYPGTTIMRGATGTATVPMIPIESLEIGELLMEPKRLPIVPDALGGAEGILGTDGLVGMRIHIDFRHDSITIMRSHNQKAPPGFVTIPAQFMRGRVLVVDAFLGGVRTKAIIDTGGQATLGNLALREALSRRRSPVTAGPDDVTGATLDVQTGDRVATPAITMGGVVVRNAAMTFADFAIFEYWKLTDEPAMLVGMDVLGLFDTLIIDYRRRELQVRLRRS